MVKHDNSNARTVILLRSTQSARYTSTRSIEEAFRTMIPMLGDSAFARDRFFESVDFVEAAVAIIPEKAAQSVEPSTTIFF